jgi:hypothetical protein
MAEYLALGVYVEEKTFRPKTSEGVSTSTAGFVGATRFGPLFGEPELLTSFLDFERIYGGLDQLEFDELVHNDLAHAVRAFFENGGQRLYVARAYRPSEPASDEGATPEWVDHGQYTVGGSVSGPDLRLRARYPGAAGNFLVTLELRLGQSIAVHCDGTTILRGATAYDTANDVVNPGRRSVPVGPPTRTSKGRGYSVWVSDMSDAVASRSESAMVNTSGASDIRLPHHQAWRVTSPLCGVGSLPPDAIVPLQAQAVVGGVAEAVCVGGARSPASRSAAGLGGLARCWKAGAARGSPVALSVGRDGSRYRY